MHRFYVFVMIRVLLLAATMLTFAFIFGDERLFFNHLILGSIIVFQVVEMIRYVSRTNRAIARLFSAVRHSDFSTTFRQGLAGSSFPELEASMDEIVKAYKTVKIQREAQFQLLQALINNIRVGIIVLADEDQITLLNPTAEMLVGIKGTRNWRLVRQSNPAFAGMVDDLGDNGRKLIELKAGNQSHMVSLDVRTIQIMELPHKLITFQDINSEIEQKEIEAWHKLIRILTHEIMNSVTPIASLTETMQGMLASDRSHQTPPKEISEETIADIRFSLETIQKRSEGLLKFVETYRKLTRVPRPTLETVELKELFASVQRLMKEALAAQAIELAVNVDPASTHAQVDRTLIEQVLINLITNSIHALDSRSNPQIELSAYRRDGILTVEVRDNGVGIPRKELDEIFVPFFSTKKHGSGIGLSLSRQIISLHGGTLKVSSQEGKGTSFYLTFGRSRD